MDGIQSSGLLAGLWILVFPSFQGAVFEPGGDHGLALFLGLVGEAVLDDAPGGDVIAGGTIVRVAPSVAEASIESEQDFSGFQGADIGPDARGTPRFNGLHLIAVGIEIAGIATPRQSANHLASCSG